MSIVSRLQLVGVLLGCVVLAGVAQTTGPSDTPATQPRPAIESTTRPVQADPHRAAADRLLKAMRVEFTLDSSIQNLLEQQIRQNPQMEPYKHIMSDFLRRHMSYDALREQFITLYVEQFTQTELIRIAEFYETAVGQKLANRMPELTIRGAEIGQEQIRRHLPELQRELLKAIKDR